MGLREIWGRVRGVEAVAEVRKTAALGGSALFAPYRGAGMGMGGVGTMPKPTVANLRKFAETPVARRAVNYVKDRIAAMEWSVAVKEDAGVAGAADRAERIRALRRALEEPNASDSFRTLLEQVLEDVLVGGFGAVEMERGDAERPVRLYAVDGATIQVNARWNGDAAVARYAQVQGGLGGGAGLSVGLGAAKETPLLDDELMYVRLNPRTHTPFGLGKMEVAFEAVSQFLSAHRYAGRLASNSVVQYALWLNERTPEQHERLIRWWQDEVEGTGRVPVLSCETKPEVLRFAGGTDADLRLQWQEFLVSMIANAFDLPAMLLGVAHDVNRATAQALQDEAFQSAVVPVAKLLAEHLTRDVIAKKLGWHDLRFVWNDLESRDPSVELEIQMKLLAAGVVSVDEVRAMRGLGEREGGVRARESALRRGDEGDGGGVSGGGRASEPVAV